MSGRRTKARRTRPSAFFVLVSTAFVMLSTAIASVTFWPVYRSTEFLVMVVVTTVVAAVVAVAGSAYRIPVNLVVLATIGVYLILGVPLAVPGRALFGVLPSPEGLGELALGTVLGWKQLLTITLPVGSFQSLLVPAFLVLLVTVTASVSIALRSDRGELAVAGPLLVFLAGILFGPTTEFLPVTTGLALTSVILLWVIWLRLYRRRNSLLQSGSPGGTSRDRVAVGLRSALSAALIIVIASAGAVAATAVLPPTASRDVLRTRIEQPFDPREYPSPLSGFRRYHQVAAVSAPVLTVTGLDAGERMRIATLDTWDGVVYTVGSDAVTSESGSFNLVPGRFDQSRVEGTGKVVRVTVGAYSGVWLPTVGKLESATFSASGAAGAGASFYYNDTTGTAAVVAGVGPGDTYSLTAIEPAQPTEDELIELTPGDAVVPPPAAMPEELTRTLGRYVDDADSPGDRLVRAMDGLRTEGYVSHGVSENEPPSRSGHSANRIAELVSDARMIGDEEQYAVAAALMAREIGFPSRVVMGFLAGEPGEGGETVLTGSDISAWIEVDTAAFGWVAIDPTPPIREIPEELPEEPTQVARPQSPVQPPVEEPELPDDQQPPDTLQDEPEAIDPFLAVLLEALRIAGGVLLAAAILASPLIAIAAAKVRRRRLRRRAPTAAARITGGWTEFEDAVLDHGYTVPPATTRSEFAGAVGGTRSLVLAAEADRAVFAPGGPDQKDADRVWSAVDELRSGLDARIGFWKRFRAQVSLRSLTGSRRAR